MANERWRRPYALSFERVYYTAKVILSKQEICFDLGGGRFLRHIARILFVTALGEIMDSIVASDALSVMDMDGLRDNMKGRLLNTIQAREQEDTIKVAPPGMYYIAPAYFYTDKNDPPLNYPNYVPLPRRQDGFFAA